MTRNMTAYRWTFIATDEQTAAIIKALLPIGVYDLDMVAIATTPDRKPKARANGHAVSNGLTKSSDVASVIRRVFSHLPNKTGTVADTHRALARAGFHKSQSKTFKNLVETGELKKLDHGRYKLVGG